MIASTPFRIAATCLLIVTVLAIFISPALESPETALRASQKAQLIAMALIAFAMLFAGFAIQVVVLLGRVFALEHNPLSIASPGTVSPLRC